MKKFSKKEKILFFISVGIVGLLVIHKVFFSGVQAKLKKINQEIKVQENRLRQALRIQRSKDIISSEYKRYADFLEKTPLEERQLKELLLKELERLTKDSGVSVINLNPQDTPVVLAGHRRYLADLRLEANMHQLVSFLYKIQQTKFLMKVDRLSLAPKDEQAYIIKVDATVSITAP